RTQSRPAPCYQSVTLRVARTGCRHAAPHRRRSPAETVFLSRAGSCKMQDVPHPGNRPRMTPTPRTTALVVLLLAGTVRPADAPLDTEGLTPAPEAARATLIRRVTLDLTGLPPAPRETDAFLADRSPDAYEKVVNRLLASPRFGERMAMDWLDQARYADTNGY